MYTVILKTGRGDKEVKLNKEDFEIMKNSGQFNYSVKEVLEKPNVLKEKEQPKEVKE